MSECVQKTLACRGLRVGPSKQRTKLSFEDVAENLLHVWVGVVLERDTQERVQRRMIEGGSGFRGSWREFSQTSTSSSLQQLREGDRELPSSRRAAHRISRGEDSNAACA